MAPFTDAARREGKRAMEGSLTAAKKVARRLAGGRKPVTEKVGKKVAALRAINYLEAAENALDEYGLDPVDLRIHLVYSTAEVAGTIRLSENAADFFEKLDNLENDKVLFLGMLGEIRDREAGDVVLRWVRPFIATPLAIAALTALRDEKGTTFLN